MSDRTLGRLMRAGDPRAREELIMRHLPLARGLALRYWRHAEPLDDLTQVAMLGLVNAVDRWDPDRGVKLSSYATPTILGELRHYFRDQTWGVRPSRRIQDLSMAVDRARDTLRVELGRSPTAGELARRLDCDEDAVIEALQTGSLRVLVSLDAPIQAASADGACTGDLIPFTDPELERVEAQATLQRLTGILDRRAREVLRLRFEEDLHQEEIAVRLGCNQVHVSRVIRASLERLHAYAVATMYPPASPARAG